MKLLEYLPLDLHCGHYVILKVILIGKRDKINPDKGTYQKSKTSEQKGTINILAGKRNFFSETKIDI